MTLNPTVGLGGTPIFSLGPVLPQSIPVLSPSVSAQVSLLLSRIYAWVGQGLKGWGTEHTSLKPLQWTSPLTWSVLSGGLGSDISYAT